MILQRLRAETRHLHERTEQLVDFPSRLRTIEAYAALLARLHGFYAPMEAELAAIDGMARLPLNLLARRKVPWLREDLETCGYTTQAIDGLPVCARIPLLGGLPGAFGCLYVLEGATLGGQLLRKEVQRVLGLSEQSGCSFFASYRDRVGPMWQAFCGLLGEFAERNPTAVESIVTSAEETFLRFGEWVAGDSDG